MRISGLDYIDDKLSEIVLQYKIDGIDTSTGIAPVETGTIIAYIGSSTPNGWLLCNGNAIPSQYSALIALVGNNTPNLCEKMVLCAENSGTLMQSGGSFNHTHTCNSHTHTCEPHTHTNVSDHIHTGLTSHEHNTRHYHYENGSHDHGGLSHTHSLSAHGHDFSNALTFGSHSHTIQTKYDLSTSYSNYNGPCAATGYQSSTSTVNMLGTGTTTRTLSNRMGAGTTFLTGESVSGTVGSDTSNGAGTTVDQTTSYTDDEQAYSSSTDSYSDSTTYVSCTNPNNVSVENAVLYFNDNPTYETTSTANLPYYGLNYIIKV